MRTRCLDGIGYTEGKSDTPLGVQQEFVKPLDSHSMSRVLYLGGDFRADQNLPFLGGDAYDGSWKCLGFFEIQPELFRH